MNTATLHLLDDMRAINLTVTLCVASILVAIGLGQSFSPSLDVIIERSSRIEERAGRIESRVQIIEAAEIAKAERLVRIESSVDLQNKILWAVLAAAIGLVVERMAALFRRPDNP